MYFEVVPYTHNTHHLYRRLEIMGKKEEGEEKKKKEKTSGLILSYSRDLLVLHPDRQTDR